MGRATPPCPLEVGGEGGGETFYLPRHLRATESTSITLIRTTKPNHNPNLIISQPVLVHIAFLSSSLRTPEEEDETKRSAKRDGGPRVVSRHTNISRTRWAFIMVSDPDFSFFCFCIVTRLSVRACIWTHRVALFALSPITRGS